MPSRADPLRRLLRCTRGSIAIEAIFFGLLLFAMGLTVFGIFPIVKAGASGAIDARTISRNAALNDSCSKSGLVPGQPATIGLREKGQVVVTCDMGIEGETAVAPEQRFWTMMAAVNVAPFGDYNRSQEPVMPFAAVSAAQRTSFLGSSAFTQTIVFRGETFVPGDETWTFAEPRWAEGHDKVFWEELTEAHRELFPNVYPSALRESSGPGTAPSLRELDETGGPALPGLPAGLADALPPGLQARLAAPRRRRAATRPIPIPAPASEKT